MKREESARLAQMPMTFDSKREGETASVAGNEQTKILGPVKSVKEIR